MRGKAKTVSQFTFTCIAKHAGMGGRCNRLYASHTHMSERNSDIRKHMDCKRIKFD